MWDTLKLEVFGSFIIHDLGLKFKKAASSTSAFRKTYFNPNEDFIQKYGFHPKLTTYEYLFGDKWVVRKFEVEGSLPKIINETSYLNIDQTQNDLVIETIPKKLANFGLECTPADIERGNVIIIAYCSNFYLPPEFAHAKDFILPMVFLDVGKRTGNIIEKLWMQIEPGYGVKFYNRLRGIGFYDKVVEIINNKFQTKEDKEVLKLVEVGSLPHSFKIENTLQNRTAVKRGLAIFFDKDERKERHIRDVLQDKISLTFTKNVFGRLADPCNVKALEQILYPLENYYHTMKARGLSWTDTQLFLAQSVAVQQLGSLQVKTIADNFSKYGRQYRQNYYERLEKITQKIKGMKLSEFFAYCKKQFDNPINPKQAN